MIQTGRFENTAGENITLESTTTSGTAVFTPPSVADIDDFLARIDSGVLSADQLNIGEGLGRDGIYSLETGPSLSLYGTQIWAEAEVNGVRFAEDIVAVANQRQFLPRYSAASPLWTQIIHEYDQHCNVRNGSCDFFTKSYGLFSDNDSYTPIYTGETIPIGEVRTTNVFFGGQSSDGVTLAIPAARALSNARISSSFDSGDDSGYVDRFLTRSTYDLDPAHYNYNADAGVLVAFGNATTNSYGSFGILGGYAEQPPFNPEDYSQEQIEYAQNFLIVGGERFQTLSDGGDTVDGFDHLDFGSTYGSFYISPRPAYNPTISYTQTTQSVSGNTQAGTVFSGGNISISGGSLSNEQSTIHAQGNLSLSGTTLTNQGLSVINQASYTCNANSSCWILNEAGESTIEIVAGQSLTTNVSSQLSSTISAGGNVTANFSGAITNTNEPVSGASNGITLTNTTIGVRNVVNPGALSPDVLDFTSADTNRLDTLASLGRVVNSDQLNQTLQTGLGQSGQAGIQTQTTQTVGEVNIQLSGNLAGTLDQGVGDVVANALAGQDVNAVTDLNITRPDISAGVTLQNVTVPNINVTTTQLSRAPPGHHYVYEERSYYTNIDTFYGSAYYSQRIGYSPNHQLNFLGNAELETRLVQQTILQNTGQALLDDNYANAAEQMQNLIDNGVTQAGELNLTPGVALSSEQVAALNNNIVWYVDREHNGQQVLVPQVYLAANGQTTARGNGASISGNNIALRSVDGDITNTGSISSNTNLTLLAVNGNISLETSTQLLRDGASGSQLIVGSSSTLEAGDNLNLQANAGRLDVSGGTLIAQSANLSGNEVSLTTTTLAMENSGIDLGSYDVASATDAPGSVERWGREVSYNLGSDFDIADNLTITSNANLSVSGANLSAGGDIALAALGGDIDISSAQDRLYDRHGIGRGWQRDESIVQQGSTLDATGSLTLSASRDIEIVTSLLQAGDHQAVEPVEGEAPAETVGGDITLTAQSIDIASSENYILSERFTRRRGIFGGGSSTHSRAENRQIAGSLLNGTGNVSLVTSADISILGSGVVSGGDATLAAGYSVGTDGALTQIESSDASVNLQGAIDNSEAFSHTRGTSFFGLNKFTEGFDAFETRNIATSISANGNIDILATGNINVTGSAVQADEDIFVSAGGDINILAEETQYYRNEYATFSGFGIFNLGGGGGGLSIGVGYMETNDVSTQSGTVQNGSSIDALGDVTIDSGNDLTVEASTIYGDGEVSLDAQNNINIITATQSQENYELHESLFIGGQLSVSNNMFGAASALYDFGNAAGRANGTYGTANAVFAGFRAYDSLMGALSSPVSVSVGIGFSQSSSESTSTTNTAVTSDIYGGDSLTVTSRSGDLSSFGASFGSEGSISLDAAQNLLLTSALSSSQNSSENSSVGGFAGVSISPTGISPTGNLNASFGEGEGWTQTHSNTHVNGGGDVTLTSGSDSTIAGGVIEGDTITVNVGGEFDLHSLQDTGERSNSSGGLGIGFGQSGITSVTPSFGQGSGSTAWVREQTGLFSAGDVSVTVGGNSDLIGSVIGSDTGDVTIDTGTLTFADLSDHDQYNDFGISVTVNTSLFAPPLTPEQTAQAEREQTDTCRSVGGCSSPNWSTQGHYAFDDRAQDTDATIGTRGEGTVSLTIRDEAAQTELEENGTTASPDSINTNLDTAQVITRDEHERVDFYLSDSSVRGVAESVQVSAEAIGQVIDNIVQSMQAAGEFTAAEATLASRIAKKVQDDQNLRTQLSACANQQGFNLWHFIVTPAYAAGACTISIDGVPTQLSTGLARKILQRVLAGAAAAGGAVSAAVTAGLVVLLYPTNASEDRREIELADGGRAVITSATGDRSAKNVVVYDASGEERVRITVERGEGNRGNIARGQYRDINGNWQTLPSSVLATYVQNAQLHINAQISQSNSGDDEGERPGIGHNGGPPLDEDDENGDNDPNNPPPPVVGPVGGDGSNGPGRVPWSQVSSDARAIIRDIEGHSGLSVSQLQRTHLADQVRNRDHAVPASDAEYAQLQRQFRNSRTRLRNEWSRNSGQPWPTDANGHLYEAHHVIPSRYGGPNQWWNIHPVPRSGHQGGVHGAGSPTRGVFPTPVP